MPPRGGYINYREEEKKILDSILGKEVYDNRIRPSGSNGTDAATIIMVNLYIRSFAKIDDVKMVRAECTGRFFSLTFVLTFFPGSFCYKTDGTVQTGAIVSSEAAAASSARCSSGCQYPIHLSLPFTPEMEVGQGERERERKGEDRTREGRPPR